MGVAALGSLYGIFAVKKRLEGKDRVEQLNVNLDDVRTAYEENVRDPDHLGCLQDIIFKSNASAHYAKLLDFWEKLVDRPRLERDSVTLTEKAQAQIDSFHDYYLSCQTAATEVYEYAMELDTEKAAEEAENLKRAVGEWRDEHFSQTRFEEKMREARAGFITDCIDFIEIDSLRYRFVKLAGGALDWSGEADLAAEKLRPKNPNKPPSKKGGRKH